MNRLKESQIKGRWEQELGRVTAHDGDGEIYKMSIYAPTIAHRAVAGQFVEIKPTPAGSTAVDPLLRRPLSICEIRKETGEISLIYRVVGRGTNALATVRPGSDVDLLGPLGHSFPHPGAGVGRLVLIGGGLGIPPMAAAAQWAMRTGREAVAILGARNQRYLAGAEEVAASGIEVITVTDDGSAGEQGFVTGPLDRLLAAAGVVWRATGADAADADADAAGATGATRDAGDAGPSTLGVGEVWACGPEGMLVAIKQRCAAAGIPCFVSVERYMACGFGACIGCTVPKAGGGGYLKACQDGPVFNAEEVVLGGF